MDYKVRSMVIILVFVIVIAAVGFILSNESITGAVVLDSVACYEDNDCNDNVAQTQDLCKNPGTEESLCINRPR